MIRKPEDPVIPVDVQRKTDNYGEFTRYFASIEEAQTYVHHMTHERQGYIAQVRYVNTDTPLTGRELSIAYRKLLKNV